MISNANNDNINSLSRKPANVYPHFMEPTFSYVNKRKSSNIVQRDLSLQRDTNLYYASALTCPKDPFTRQRSIPKRHSSVASTYDIPAETRASRYVRSSLNTLPRKSSVNTHKSCYDYPTSNGLYGSQEYSLKEFKAVSRNSVPRASSRSSIDPRVYRPQTSSIYKNEAHPNSALEKRNAIHQRYSRTSSRTSLDYIPLESAVSKFHQSLRFGSNLVYPKGRSSSNTSKISAKVTNDESSKQQNIQMSKANSKYNYKLNSLDGRLSSHQFATNIPMLRSRTRISEMPINEVCHTQQKSYNIFKNAATGLRPLQNFTDNAANHNYNFSYFKSMIFDKSQSSWDITRHSIANICPNKENPPSTSNIFKVSATSHERKLLLDMENRLSFMNQAKPLSIRSYDPLDYSDLHNQKIVQREILKREEQLKKRAQQLEQQNLLRNQSPYVSRNTALKFEKKSISDEFKHLDSKEIDYKKADFKEIDFNNALAAAGSQVSLENLESIEKIGERMDEIYNKHSKLMEDFNNLLQPVFDANKGGKTLTESASEYGDKPDATSTEKDLFSHSNPELSSSIFKNISSSELQARSEDSPKRQCNLGSFEYKKSPVVVVQCNKIYTYQNDATAANTDTKKTDMFETSPLNEIRTPCVATSSKAMFKAEFDHYLIPDQTPKTEKSCLVNSKRYTNDESTLPHDKTYSEFNELSSFNIEFPENRHNFKFHELPKIIQKNSVFTNLSTSNQPTLVDKAKSTLAKDAQSRLTRRLGADGFTDMLDASNNRMNTTDDRSTPLSSDKRKIISSSSPRHAQDDSDVHNHLANETAAVQEIQENLESFELKDKLCDSHHDIEARSITRTKSVSDVRQMDPAVEKDSNLASNDNISFINRSQNETTKSPTSGAAARSTVSSCHGKNHESKNYVNSVFPDIFSTPTAFSLISPKFPNNSIMSGAKNSKITPGFINKRGSELGGLSGLCKQEPEPVIIDDNKDYQLENFQSIESPIIVSKQESLCESKEKNEDTEDIDGVVLNTIDFVEYERSISQHLQQLDDDFMDVSSTLKKEVSTQMINQSMDTEKKTYHPDVPQLHFGDSIIQSSGLAIENSNSVLTASPTKARKLYKSDYFASLTSIEPSNQTICSSNRTNGNFNSDSESINITLSEKDKESQLKRFSDNSQQLLSSPSASKASQSSENSDSGLQILTVVKHTPTSSPSSPQPPQSQNIFASIKFSDIMHTPKTNRLNTPPASSAQERPLAATPNARGNGVSGKSFAPVDQASHSFTFAQETPSTSNVCKADHLACSKNQIDAASTNDLSSNLLASAGLDDQKENRTFEHASEQPSDHQSTKRLSAIQNELPSTGSASAFASSANNEVKMCDSIYRKSIIVTNQFSQECANETSSFFAAKSLFSGNSETHKSFSATPFESHDSTKNLDSHGVNSSVRSIIDMFENKQVCAGSKAKELTSTRRPTYSYPVASQSDHFEPPKDDDLSANESAKKVPETFKAYSETVTNPSNKVPVVASSPEFSAASAKKFSLDMPSSATETLASTLTKPDFKEKHHKPLLFDPVSTTPNFFQSKISVSNCWLNKIRNYQPHELDKSFKTLKVASSKYKRKSNSFLQFTDSMTTAATTTATAPAALAVGHVKPANPVKNDTAEESGALEETALSSTLLRDDDAAASSLFDSAELLSDKLSKSIFAPSVSKNSDRLLLALKNQSAEPRTSLLESIPTQLGAARNYDIYPFSYQDEATTEQQTNATSTPFLMKNTSKTPSRRAAAGFTQANEQVSYVDWSPNTENFMESPLLK